MANEFAEFERNYEMCFFRKRLQLSGKYRPFLLHAMEDGYTVVVGSLLSKTLLARTQKYTAKDFMKEAEPIIPTRGFVNLSLSRPTALYVTVSPHRQYRKGLSADGVTGTYFLNNRSPHHLDYDMEKRKGLGGEWPIRALAFQLSQEPVPIYPAIRGAIERVLSGEAHSIAISRFFAISLVGNIIYPVIWHKTAKVGVIHEGMAYGTSQLLPFSDFFMKKWQLPMLPIHQAPRSKEYEEALRNMKKATGAYTSTISSGTSTFYRGAALGRDVQW